MANEAATLRKLRVERFSLAVDGFGAGPAQSPDYPLGKGGEGLHALCFRTMRANPLTWPAARSFIL